LGGVATVGGSVIMYFVGVVHPPPSDRLKLLLHHQPGYAFERHQLVRAAAMMWRLPVTLNHYGIAAAVSRGYDKEQNVKVPTQRTVVAQLEALSGVDHKFAIVGNVIDFFEASKGGFYVIFKITHAVDAVSWLVTHGHLTGLSLTHVFPDDDSGGDFVPYEVTLCIKPKRPFCYIVTASRDLGLISEYKRSIQSGTIRDRSSNLAKPDSIRIMSTAADMPVDPPEATVSVAAAEPAAPAVDPLDAVGKILDDMPEENSKVLTTGFLNLKKRGDKYESENKKIAAELATERAARVAAEKAHSESNLSVGLLKSYVGMLQEGTSNTRSGKLITPEVVAGLSSPDPAIREMNMGRVIHAAAYSALEMRGDSNVFQAAAEARPGDKRARPSELLSGGYSEPAPAAVTPAAAGISHPSDGALGGGAGPQESALSRLASQDYGRMSGAQGRARVAPHMASAGSAAAVPSGVPDNRAELFRAIGGAFVMDQ
jgi:hypothetical protein